MNRAVRLAALLALGTRSLAAQSDFPWSTHQVIPGDVIRGAGATRLSDILLLADDWDLSTVEGFSWDVSVRGHSSFDRQTWQVMVDGTLMDLSQFGTMNVNRLPVQISQIDSVEIVSIPQFHDGVFAVGGIMHIHTAQPAPGLSARAHWTTGNEIGDPGPFLHTPLRTRNIEQTGPDNSETISYADTNFYVEASHSTIHHVVSDAAIGSRNRMVAGRTQIVSTGLAARVGTRIVGRGLEGFFRETHIDDFFFLKALGRELPVRNTFRTIGLTGSAGNGTYGIHYDVTHTVNDLRHDPNALDLDYDWRRRSVRLSLVGERQHHDAHSQLGVSLRNIAVDTRYPLGENGYTTGTVHGAIHHVLAPRLEQQLGGSLMLSSTGNIGFDAVANHRFLADRQTVIGANISYSRRLPQHDGRIWFWRDRGYGFLEDAGVAATTDDPVGMHRQLAVDITWSRRIGHSAQVKVAGFLRSVGGVHVADQRFVFQPADLSFTSPVHLAADQVYEVIGGDVALQWEQGSRWTTRLYYRLQHARGDSVVADMLKALPSHKVHWRIHVTPAATFSLWSRFSYRSGARWPAFDGIEGQAVNDHVYSATISDMASLDLAAVKSFAKGRIWTTLGIRNLFTDTIRYHPIGATFDMTLFFQGELRLDSLL